MGAPMGVVEIHFQLEIATPEKVLLRHWKEQPSFWES